MKKKNQISTDNSNDLFEQFCIERAKKLERTKKRLFVLWSGTKESTIIVKSILKVVPVTRLYFIMNQNSLKKDFKTYDKFISKISGGPDGAGEQIWCEKITKKGFIKYILNSTGPDPDNFDPKKDLFVGCSDDLDHLFEKDVDIQNKLCYIPSIT